MTHRLTEIITELIVKELGLTIKKNKKESKIRDLALISKSFIEPVRRRLFNKIELNNEEKYARFTCLDPLHIYPHIQEFTVEAHLFQEDTNLPKVINDLAGTKRLKKLHVGFQKAPDCKLSKYWDRKKVPDRPGSVSWNTLSGDLQDALKALLGVRTLDSVSVKGLWDMPESVLSSIVCVPNVTLGNSGFADNIDGFDQSRKKADSRPPVKSLTISYMNMPPATLETLEVKEDLGPDRQTCDIAQTIIDTQSSITTLIIKDEWAVNLGNLPNLRTLHYYMNFDGKPFRYAIDTFKTIRRDNQIEECRILLRYWCFCCTVMLQNEDEESWSELDWLFTSKLCNAERVVWGILMTNKKENQQHKRYVRKRLPRTSKTGLLELYVREEW